MTTLNLSSPIDIYPGQKPIPLFFFFSKLKLYFYVVTRNVTIKTLALYLFLAVFLIWGTPELIYNNLPCHSFLNVFHQSKRQPPRETRSTHGMKKSWMTIMWFYFTEIHLEHTKTKTMFATHPLCNGWVANMSLVVFSHGPHVCPDKSQLSYCKSVTFASFRSHRSFMNVLVCFQFTLNWKSFPTLKATKWYLSRMDILMCL